MTRLLRRLNCWTKWRTSSGISSTTLAQRRHAHGEHVQAIVQVGAELLRLHHRIEVAIRGGNQTRVGAQRARAAETLELTLLQHAQQFRLQLQRDLADFVEKHRAAVRQLEAADALRDGAVNAPFSWPNSSLSSRPVGIAAQFIFTKACRLARAQVVHGARDQFLARCRSRRRSAPSNRSAPRFRPACSTRRRPLLLPTISSKFSSLRISSSR